VLERRSDESAKGCGVVLPNADLGQRVAGGVGDVCAGVAERPVDVEQRDAVHLCRLR
jgi:hypothetical protein